MLNSESSNKDNNSAVAHEAVKLISCIINSEEVKRDLLQALYDERHITRVNSTNCRGYTSSSLPQAHFTHLIEVIVAESQADELFDFIFRKAGLDKPDVGVVFIAPLHNSSNFYMPDENSHE